MVRYTREAREHALKMRQHQFQFSGTIIYSSSQLQTYPNLNQVPLAPDLSVPPSPEEQDTVCRCNEIGGNCRSDACARYHENKLCGTNCLNPDCENKRGHTLDCIPGFYEKLIVDYYVGKGNGVKTMAPIPANTDIAPYTGYAVLKIHLRHLPNDSYLAVLTPDGQTVIDAASIGTIAAMINHKCVTANATFVQLTTATGERHIIVRTLRDIAAGEEITVNYGLMDLSDASKPTPCNCGDDGCVGHVELGGNEPDLNTITGLKCAVERARNHDNRVTLRERYVFEPTLSQLHYPRRYDADAIRNHKFVPSSIVGDSIYCQLCYLQLTMDMNELELAYGRKELVMPNFAKFKIKKHVGFCLDCNIALCHDCFYDSNKWHLGPSEPVAQPNPAVNAAVEAAANAEEVAPPAVNAAVEVPANAEEVAPPAINAPVEAPPVVVDAPVEPALDNVPLEEMENAIDDLVIEVMNELNDSDNESAESSVDGNLLKDLSMEYDSGEEAWENL